VTCDVKDKKGKRKRGVVSSLDFIARFSRRKEGKDARSTLIAFDSEEKKNHPLQETQR